MLYSKSVILRGALRSIFRKSTREDELTSSRVDFGAEHFAALPCALRSDPRLRCRVHFVVTQDSRCRLPAAGCPASSRRPGAGDSELPATRSQDSRCRLSATGCPASSQRPSDSESQSGPRACAAGAGSGRSNASSRPKESESGLRTRSPSPSP